MPDAENELTLERKSDDDIGMTHLRLKQVFQGVSVYGAEVIVHYQLGGRKVSSVNGIFLPNLKVNATPDIDSEKAVAIVREIQQDGELWEKPLLSIYSGHIDHAVQGNHLAWLVRIYNESEPSRNLYVVDAHTGDVLTSYDELPDAKNRTVSDAGNTTAYPGTTARSEGQGAVGDAAVNNVYDFLGATYDFFFQQFGRDSYDGSGAALNATIRYCPPGEACPWANAQWNGSRMLFGDGYTVDDITAHELSHAVTERTANLTYHDQSGALNESYSDIFGEIVDLDYATGNDAPGNEWIIGEDLPIGSLRNMANPPASNDISQPDKVSDYNCTFNDDGGVHINSGIPNKAAWLMSAGGSFNGQNVIGIGRAKMGQVQYRALSQHLTSSSGLVDYYNLMNQSCQELIGQYGITSGNCNEVDKALLAVEMNKEPGDVCIGGNTIGWASAYVTLLSLPSDLSMMRQYRDDILYKTSAGKLYVEELYKNSEEALKVLNDNPELMNRAGELIQANKDAVADVLAQGNGTIHDTDAITDFLADYAKASPSDLRFLVNKVRVDMKKHKQEKKQFFGFILK